MMTGILTSITESNDDDNGDGDNEVTAFFAEVNHHWGERVG